MSSQTGTVSSTTGTSGWTNPNNIFVSDNVYAVTSSSIEDLGVSGSIYALGNGFSVPSSATIDGIEVAIEGKNSLSGNGFRVRANSSDIFLRYSGANLSTNSPSGVTTSTTWSGTTETTNVFGSSTALWSSTITPSIVNDSSFGVRVRFQNINASSQTFSVDYIGITVYYTDAGVQYFQQFFWHEF